MSYQEVVDHMNTDLVKLKTYIAGNMLDFLKDLWIQIL